MKKKLIAIITLCLSLILAMPFFYGCGGNGNQAVATSFVSLDINPSIELTLDNNNKVVSVRGTNEDGQVLLYGEANFVGKDVETVIQEITDLAIEHGYISQDNKVVNTSVSAESNQKAQDILNKINAKITATAKSASINVTVDGEGAYSLLRRYEQFKKAHPNSEVVKNLSVSQFKLAMSASETGEVSLEAAVELDTEKLVEIISKAHAKMESYATDAYLMIKAQANSIYESAKGTVLDLIYIPYSPIKGATYNLYKTSARTIDGVAQMLALFEKIGAYALTDEQVANIVLALGLENSEAVKNSDGVVTLESVYAYVDKTIKNMTEEQATELKAQIETAITSIENSVDVQIKAKMDEMVDQIQSVLDAIVIENETINKIVNGLKDGVTASELKGYADDLNQKASEVLAQIEADLTDEQKQNIANKKAEVEKTLSQAKAKFDKALADGEAQAIEKLNQLKQNRKTSK